MYETKTQSTCLCTLIPIIYKGSIASFISSCDFYLAQPDRNNTAFILGCRISISFRRLISHKYQQSTFLNKTITKKCSCPFVPLVTIESKAELFTDSLFEELRTQYLPQWAHLQQHIQLPLPRSSAWFNSFCKDCVVARNSFRGCQKRTMRHFSPNKLIKASNISFPLIRSQTWMSVNLVSDSYCNSGH